MKAKCFSSLWLLFVLGVFCSSSCMPYRTTRFDQWSAFIVDSQIHVVAQETLELKIRTMDNPKTLSRNFYITHFTFSPEDAALESYERYDMPDSMFMYDFSDESCIYQNHPSEQADTFIIYNFVTKKYRQKEGVAKSLSSSPLFHIEIDSAQKSYIFKGELMIAELPSPHGRDPRTAIAYLPEKQTIVYMDFLVSKAAGYDKYNAPTICRIYEHILTDTYPALKYEFMFTKQVEPSYHPRDNKPPLIIFDTPLGGREMFFNGNKLIESRKLPTSFNFFYSIYFNDIFYKFGKLLFTYNMETNELITHYRIYVNFWGTLKIKPDHLTRKSKPCEPIDALSSDFESKHPEEWEQIYD